MLIGKLAEITGMSKDGIRHYEELGLIASSPRQAGTRWYRDYDESVVDTIEKVRQAQQLGFSLREIGPLLKAYREKPPTKAQTIAFLNERLTIVREKLETLRGVESFILEKLRHYDVHNCPPSWRGTRGRHQAARLLGVPETRKKRRPARSA